VVYYENMYFTIEQNKPGLQTQTLVLLLWCCTHSKHSVIYFLYFLHKEIIEFCLDDCIYTFTSNSLLEGPLSLHTLFEFTHGFQSECHKILFRGVHYICLDKVHYNVARKLSELFLQLHGLPVI
jgi:hypothetical protein